MYRRRCLTDFTVPQHRRRKSKLKVESTSLSLFITTGGKCSWLMDEWKWNDVQKNDHLQDKLEDWSNSQRSVTDRIVSNFYLVSQQWVRVIHSLQRRSRDTGEWNLLLSRYLCFIPTPRSLRDTTQWLSGEQQRREGEVQNKLWRIRLNYILFYWQTVTSVKEVLCLHYRCGAAHSVSASLIFVFVE